MWVCSLCMCEGKLDVRVCVEPEYRMKGGKVSKSQLNESRESAGGRFSLGHQDGNTVFTASAHFQ